MYTEIMNAFIFAALIICVIGVGGIIICVYFTAKSAQKISNDIAKGMSRKIEEQIRKDIDSGKFYY